MSYCRWSSMGFMCDLYCYASNSGFEIHIASVRREKPIPELNLGLIDKEPEKFLEQVKIRSKLLDEIKFKPIGLPFDGCSYTLPDLESFKEKILELKEIGYLYPDYVLEQVNEEILEESGAVNEELKMKL